MAAFPAQVTTATVTAVLTSAVVDGSDVDLLPDAVPLTGQVTFTPDRVNGQLMVPTATPPLMVTVKPMPVTLDGTGALSVNLVVIPGATYTVSFALSGVRIAPFSIGPLEAGMTYDLASLARTVAMDGVAYTIGPATDASIATAVSTSGTATRTALDAAFADKPTLAAVRASTATDAPPIVTLMGCQADEAYGLTNCTTAPDLVNFKVGAQGQKVTTAAAVTATVLLDPPGPIDPMIMPPAAVVGFWVYLPAPTKITSITVEVYSTFDLGTPGKFNRSISAATPMVVGWNLIRWPASDGVVDMSNWGTVYRVRIVAVTNAATDFTVGHVWAETPPKAQILFVADRGYRSLKDGGLADLRALGIPVTWALDPALNGTSPGTIGEVITDADVATFAAAGDSISFHSWDGAVTSTMTATQIAADTMKAIRWLQQHGYPGRIWRAAWTQNSAPQHAAAQPLVMAYATPSSVASFTAWPLINRWNVPRYAVHGRTNADLDTVFTTLQRSHGLICMYTHGINAAGGNDITPTSWAYFISKIAAGVAAGWLEGVTFEGLYAGSGGKFKSVFGPAQAEYPDAMGAIVTRPLI